MRWIRLWPPFVDSSFGCWVISENVPNSAGENSMLEKAICLKPVVPPQKEHNLHARTSPKLSIASWNRSLFLLKLIVPTPPHKTPLLLANPTPPKFWLLRPTIGFGGIVLLVRCGSDWIEKISCDESQSFRWLRSTCNCLIWSALLLCLRWVIIFRVLSHCLRVKLVIVSFDRHDSFYNDICALY